ncbi:Oidioi.mRNA.OKI2018_I69.chr1.g183.t1.cds [Oikopleura dioica]|uniref:Oidioi.mRNA.OKI2018_I69.chr1.g183.t1.cds n=1 Tax=Oikopleura dioica TaxID=34765 RepID=A0ABN7SJ18_OIKDI|nr:Oidioi.mRNA.OKI2018_I69.chr1.g183.t1.cds [Oikopleura dioica]
MSTRRPIDFDTDRRRVRSRSRGKVLEEDHPSKPDQGYQGERGRARPNFQNAEREIAELEDTVRSLNMIDPKPSPAISIGTTSSMTNGSGIRSRIPVPVSRPKFESTQKEPRKLPPLLPQNSEEKREPGPPRFRPPEVDINSLMNKFSKKEPVQPAAKKQEILQRHKDLVSTHLPKNQPAEKFPSPPTTPKQPPSGFQPVGNSKPRPFGFYNPPSAETTVPEPQITKTIPSFHEQEMQSPDISRGAQEHEQQVPEIKGEEEEKDFEEWNERYKDVREEHLSIFEEQEQMFQELKEQEEESLREESEHHDIEYQKRLHQDLAAMETLDSNPITLRSIAASEKQPEPQPTKVSKHSDSGYNSVSKTSSFRAYESSRNYEQGSSSVGVRNFTSKTENFAVTQKADQSKLDPPLQRTGESKSSPWRSNQSKSFEEKVQVRQRPTMSFDPPTTSSIPARSSTFSPASASRFGQKQSIDDLIKKFHPRSVKTQPQKAADWMPPTLQRIKKKPCVKSRVSAFENISEDRPANDPPQQQVFNYRR